MENPVPVKLSVPVEMITKADGPAWNHRGPDHPYLTVTKPANAWQGLNLAGPLDLRNFPVRVPE
jgi:hypothetical protein